MVVILYLFEHRNIHPPFCYQCILKRGGIRERHLLGDFSRYETHYIVRLILIGSILVTMLSWILFAFGVERQSRAGNYFYFYFPLGLSIAIIIFEIIRRLLIQQLIESHEKNVNVISTTKRIIPIWITFHGNSYYGHRSRKDLLNRKQRR